MLFNLGSSWELREDKTEEALWEVPGLETSPTITEKVRDGPRNGPKKHRECVRRGLTWVSPCCKCFIAPLWFEGYMFLHMNYCESEHSATPQPHMTQLTGGGWEESQGHAGGIDEQTDRLRCRSWNFTSLVSAWALVSRSWRCVLIVSRPRDLINTTQTARHQN